MMWQYRKACTYLALLGMILTGCRPQQPFYFHEDGDLSHYIGMATEISYPDTDVASLEEVDMTQAPLTLANQTFESFEDITLEEAVKNALANGKVLRNLGGRFASTGDPRRAQVGEAPNSVLSSVERFPTIYDPAIQDSGVGTDGFFGPEAALSAFDAQLNASLFYEETEGPTNQVFGAFPAIATEDAGTFQAEIAKTAVTGSQFFIRNNTQYSRTNSPIALFPSNWRTNIEAEVRQPLLQGAGVQYNRIAGPYSPFRGIGSQAFDGVILARINTDITIADFEGGVRDLVRDVENTYWELYFAYRNLESQKVGLESSRQTWKKIKALFDAGLRGGEAEKEAQAREQYYNFLGQVQTAKSDLFRAENRLRYMMGLTASDGRLFRPADDPTTAKADFDWYATLCEGLARSVEIRQQRWRVKQRELELIASKNHLLPRLDAVGLYRFAGFGDDLIDHSDRFAGTANAGFESAFGNLLGGDFQEWEAGLQLNIPIGFRRELAQVRHHQLLLVREKALVQEQELELSHQLADAIRNLDQNYTLVETNFNRRVAAEKQVRSVEAAYEAEKVTLDLLLEAQRRLSEAESAYFRTLIDYNRGIATLHYVKGSLLEYNGVYLAEGPWPQKAYFDAHRLARKRDAAHYMDYGFTRPSVISRGPYQQHAGGIELHEGEIIHGGAIDGMIIDERFIEEVPAPMPIPDPQAKRNSAAAGARVAATPRAAETEGFDWGSLGAKQPTATATSEPKMAEIQQVSATAPLAPAQQDAASAAGKAKPATRPASSAQWKSR